MKVVVLLLLLSNNLIPVNLLVKPLIFCGQILHHSFIALIADAIIIIDFFITSITITGCCSTVLGHPLEISCSNILWALHTIF